MMQSEPVAGFSNSELVMDGDVDGDVDGNGNGNGEENVGMDNLRENNVTPPLKVTNHGEEALPDIKGFGNIQFQKLRQKKPVTLEWKKLNLKIGEKHILKDLNGRVESNEVMALMGPSGSGKSSLLNVLAGRIASTGKKQVSGTILANGIEIKPKLFRESVAYVLQEDSLFATATCREALEFSAALRLPKTFSRNERDELVEDFLTALGLKHVENTLIGSELVRGLSGGEKKRVAVGVELITNPSVLLLDEPTSGLDSYSAVVLMKILHSIAKTGAIVQCSLHQPSSEIFLSFHKIVFLANGRTIYAGDGGNNIGKVFARHGFEIPANTNLADFVMFMVQIKSEEELPHWEGLSPPSTKSGEEAIEEGRQGTQQTESSLEKTSMVNSRSLSHTSTMSRSEMKSELGIQKTAGFFEQTWRLTKREFLGVIRDKAGLIGRFAGTIVLNLLISGIFFDSANPDSSDFTVFTAFGALTQVFIGALFGASQPAILTFPLERVTFIREYGSNMYSSSAYFISKLLVELPLTLATALCIFIVAYPMMNFQGNIFYLICIAWLLSLASASTALLVGSIVPDAKTAQEIAPLIFVPQLLFAGFFIQIEQIPSILQWVQYLCSMKYAINLSLIVEFGDCSHFADDEVQFDTCQQLFSANDVENDLDWFYVLILLVIFFGFRGLSLSALAWRARNFA